MKKTLSAFRIGLKKIIKIFVILTLIISTYSYVTKILRNHIVDKHTLSGIDMYVDKETEEIWKQTKSDISDMSLWDKHKAGLSISSGSDSDGDGLTDKEEIETYKSDPLKESTSGDLYTDLYKIQNNMEINKKYDYTENIDFPYNQVPDIILKAYQPSDFNAVVTDTTGKNTLSSQQVFRQYKIYNYSGNVSVDISSILQDNDISASDLSVYVSDGRNIKKEKIKITDDIITINKKFDNLSEYEIFIVQKNTLAGLNITFSGVSSIEKATKDDVTGEGLIMFSPILSQYFKVPVKIEYEDLEETNDNVTFVETIITHIKTSLSDLMGSSYNEYFGSDGHSSHNAAEIKAKYNLLKSFIPMFDVTCVRQENLMWYNLFLSYYSYADRVEFESERDENKDYVSTSGFDIYKDTLPFENFKTELAPSGNCTGIAHLTSYLYNNKEFPATGSYSNESASLTWNLLKDTENRTLVDAKLYDYKDRDFVKEHSSNQYLNKELSEGEQEFVKMIGANFLKGNYLINNIYTSNYSNKNNQILFDYSVIDEVIRILNQRKIVDVHMKMLDGKGHTVNVYGYESDETDSDVIWLNVYDSNFPYNYTYGSQTSEKGFRIKITKKKSLQGNGYCFAFTYAPFEDVKYGATSNVNLIKNPFILFTDENWTDINPVINYPTYENDFYFSYVSTADKMKDFQTVCHYTDSYFFNSSITGTNQTYGETIIGLSGEEKLDIRGNGYNSSLATASLSLAMSAFGSNEGGIEDYSHKYKNVEDFLIKAGFSDFSCNDWFIEKPGTDTIGAASASKVLLVDKNGNKEKYTLIALAVRGGGYEREWASNLTLGLSGQHQGFDEAKNNVLKFLKEYIKQNNISGDIKLWITGFSRAAATANLVAGELNKGFSLGYSVKLKPDDLYAYCFEPPMGGLFETVLPEEKHYNIYNIVNRNDIVTKVAMEAFAFQRYGIDISLSDSQNTKNYENNKAQMLSFYENLPSYSAVEMAYSIDNFQAKKISVDSLKNAVSELLKEETTNRNEIDAEESKSFFQKLSEWFSSLVKNALVDDYDMNYTMHYYLDIALSDISTENIKTRENYVVNYQDSLRALLAFATSGEILQSNFKETLIENMKETDFVLNMTATAILLNSNNSIIDTATIYLFIENSVDKLLEESLQEAKVYSTDVNTVKTVRKALINLVLPIVKEHSNYVATLIYNINEIGSAHYPELCLAWLMAGDMNFTDNPIVFTGNTGSRQIIVNCPIDIEVYDDNSTLIASIEDNTVSKKTKSKGLVAINKDGEKIVTLPYTSQYTIKLIATDSGIMNVTIKDSENILTQQYKDISLSKDDSFEIIAPSVSEQDILSKNAEKLKLYSFQRQNGEKVEASDTYDSSFVPKTYTVNPNTENVEKGFVMGGGTYEEDSFAQVAAYSLEGNKFIGWYIGNELVSMDETYRFCVISDIELVAKFEESTDLQVNKSPSILPIIIFIPLFFIIILLLYRKRKNKKQGK